MEHIIKQLKSNWMIIIVIATAIMWYTTVNDKFANADASNVQHEADLKSIFLKMDEMNARISNQSIDIAELRTSIDFIKERVK